MKRLVCSAILAAMAAPCFAQSTPADDIISALRSHGYRIVVQERTWLGRERVVAETSSKRREVVFNPGTGEIMRDYVVALARGDGTADALAGVGTGVGVAADPVAKDGPVFGLDTPSVGVAVDTEAVVNDPVADPLMGTSE